MSKQSNNLCMNKGDKFSLKIIPDVTYETISCKMENNKWKIRYKYPGTSLNILIKVPPSSIIKR